MFEFPDNCISSEDRVEFCYRYQEIQHELSCEPILDGPANYGGIMEVQRASRVAEMIPFLIKAINAHREAPAFVARKEHWDGKKIVRNFDINNKGTVLLHVLDVEKLNSTSPDLDKISAEVRIAREACLHDTKWDKDIN